MGIAGRTLTAVGREATGSTAGDTRRAGGGKITTRDSRSEGRQKTGNGGTRGRAKGTQWDLTTGKTGGQGRRGGDHKRRRLGIAGRMLSAVGIDATGTTAGEPRRAEGGV